MIDDSDSLADYPCAFLRLQEYAFVGIDETHVEAQHSVIAKALAPTGFMKPATVCAMLRINQMKRLLKNEQFFNFVTLHWDDHLWEPLLRPLRGRRGIPQSPAARLSFIYSFSVSKQHANLDRQRLAGHLWHGVLAIKAVAKPQAPSPQVQLMLDWLKSRFCLGVVYSLPCDVFEAALRDADPDITSALDSDELLQVLQGVPNAGAPPVQGHVFSGLSAHSLSGNACSNTDMCSSRLG